MWRVEKAGIIQTEIPMGQGLTQLTSEPSGNRCVGAAAAFETLGAVNNPLSLVRTVGYDSGCMSEARGMR